MKCKHCKNESRLHFGDNGMHPSAFEYTVQCTAPVEPGQESNDDFDHDDPENAPHVGVCGHMWCPNEDRLDDEPDDYGAGIGEGHSRGRTPKARSLVAQAQARQRRRHKDGKL